ncbi:MAG: hypothetical protein CMO01_02880 [Thalassobius sp.]|nr:hypothetical protein [Thalassovita sp.]
MQLSVYLFISLISLFSTGVLHPVHLAVTQVDYNSNTNSLEVTHKIFIDDFESAMELTNVNDLKLGTDGEIENADEYIQKYIDEHFKITVNGKATQPVYIGRENDLVAIWVYQEIKNVTDLKDIELHNEILLDLYDDQKNILHVKYGDVKRSFLFRKDQTDESMTL